MFNHLIHIILKRIFFPFLVFPSNMSPVANARLYGGGAGSSSASSDPMDLSDDPNTGKILEKGEPWPSGNGQKEGQKEAQKEAQKEVQKEAEEEDESESESESESEESEEESEEEPEEEPKKGLKEGFEEGQLKNKGNHLVKDKSSNEDKRAQLKKVAKETQQEVAWIVLSNRDKNPRNAYLAKFTDIAPLNNDDPYFPDFPNTAVRIFKSDTLDAAITLKNDQEVVESADPRPICVLNFANAYQSGGGWLNGASAQEEHLFFRSTLSTAVPERFYPIAERDCIYSPTVIIFKENVTKGFSKMWVGKPDLLPVVSVISMPAENRPAVRKVDGKIQYKSDATRALMEDKMRMVLRVAAYNHHRELILGALGCGAFGHPSTEVANCWKRVLQEPEFKGWFGVIVFAILDTPSSNNLPVFKDILEGVEV